MHEYALHWDNFHDSLSSGFLGVWKDQVGVDVTLVCDGGLLQAHKLVLTICSPYFRQIFALNPCQHPIVVLKDVNQLVMQDLLSFIYKGEVNVKENNFEQFMKMAKMLQIKGLATSDDIENSTSTTQDRKPAAPKKPTASSTPASSQKVNISIKPKLGAKRSLDKDDAEPSTSKRPARAAAPKSFEDPLDDESMHSGATKPDEPIQFEAIKCESVDLNVEPEETPFRFDYTEGGGDGGDDTTGAIGFDDDDNDSDDDDDDFDATNDSAANTSSLTKTDTEKKKDDQDLDFDDDVHDVFCLPLKNKSEVANLENQLSNSVVREVLTERLKSVDGVTRDELLINMLDFLFTPQCLISFSWQELVGNSDFFYYVKICDIMCDAMRHYHHFENTTNDEIQNFVINYSKQKMVGQQLSRAASKKVINYL